MLQSPVANLPASLLTHLTCSGCHKEYAASQVQTYCRDCNSPLLASYDLEQIHQGLSRATVSARPAGMWRWHELLPVQNASAQITLDEGNTPLLPLKNVGAQLGLSNLFLKDEGCNPPTCPKTRGMAVAVLKAKELGLQKVTLTAREVGARALAAYATRVGLQAQIYLSAETPATVLEKLRQPGIEVTLVENLASNSNGGFLKADQAEGVYNLSAFHEPYRLEGQKTIGYELAEALGWVLPDVIVCPTGYGSNLIGIWKAFAELEALGWLDGARRPRFVAVQARGCAPVVKAFEARASFCDYWTNARTIASDLIVPKSFADQLILKILYESAGLAVSVSDEAIQAAQRQMRTDEELDISFEGAAAFAALFKLVQKKWVQPGERIVLLNTGQKPGQ